MRRLAALRAIELWALLGVVAAVFVRPLTGSTFFFRDIYVFFYPRLALLSRMWRDGIVPLWNPFDHGGEPFGLQWYPTEVLFLVLPPLRAFNLLIVLQYLGCAAAAWWLAREYKLSRSAAFVAGAVYALSGYSLSWANLFVNLLALPWIPLCAGFARRAVLRRSGRAIVLASLCGAVTLSAGAAEATAAMFVVLAVVIAGESDRAKIGRAAVVVATVVIFTFLLAAISVIPTMQAIAETRRGGTLPYATFTMWSVHPWRLFELVAPDFFGHFDFANPDRYWGRRFEGNGWPYIVSIYFGAVALTLAAAGFLSKRAGATEVPRRALGGLAIAGIAGSLGAHLPFFHAVYEAAPILAMFRYPVKAILVSLLPIAILSARGVDAVTADVRTRRAVAATLGSVALVTGIVAVALLASATFSDSFSRGVFGGAPPRSFRTDMAKSFAHVFAAALAGLAFTIVRLQPRIAAAGLAAVAALDLAIAGYSVNTYASPEIFDAPAILRPVQQLVGPGRLASTDLLRTARIGRVDIRAAARYEISTLTRYQASHRGIRMIYTEDYGATAPRREERLRDAMSALPWPEKIPLLQIGAVTALIAHANVPPLAAIHRRALVPSPDMNPVYLYSLDGAYPARFLSNVTASVRDEDALALMTHGFDTTHLLLSDRAAKADGCGTAPVAVNAYGLSRVSYSVDAPCDGYVFFSENFYPGWKATVDGRRAALVRANYAFSAVAVAKGRHLITRTYAPAAPLLGVIVSVLSLIALLILGRLF